MYYKERTMDKKREKTSVKLFCSFLLLALTISSFGQYNNTTVYSYQDTILGPTIKKPFFQRQGVKIAVPPLLFFGASAATWSDREKIREIRNRYIPTFANGYDNYMQYMPAVSVYALNLAGVKGKNNLGRATVSYGASALIMGIIVNSIKYTAKVERPDGSQNNSFPSGHTSNAFTNATFMHKEFGHLSPGYSIAGYTMGTFTAIGRGLNNRHWVSDVLAGMGIGILSTQLGYFFVDKMYKNEGDRPGDNTFENPLDRPSYLSLRVGYASASRNLARDLELGISSQTGFEAGLEGAYYFNENWGIGGDFSFVSFPISTDDITVNDPDFGSATAEIVTESIGALNFTVGPHYSYQIAPDWVAQARIGAGVSFGATGKLSFQVADFDDDNNIINDEFDLLSYKPDAAFKMNGGLSLTYMLNPELGITAYSDYHYSNPNFTFTLADDVTDPESTVQTSVSERDRLDYFTAGLRLTAFF